MLRIAGEELTGTAARAAPPLILRSDPSRRTIWAVGTGLVGVPACGGVMKLPINVNCASGTIVDARFKTFGCGSAFGHRFVVCWQCRLVELKIFNLLNGWKAEKWRTVLSIENAEIAKHLALPPVKLHCSMLAEDAVMAAVKDYKAKHAKSNGGPDANPKAVDA